MIKSVMSIYELNKLLNKLSCFRKGNTLLIETVVAKQ